MAGPATKALLVAGGLVREIWPDESLLEEVIEEDPILGMAAKETDWGEDVRHHPLGWGASQGIGRDFATAKRLKGQAKQAEFQYGTREIYAALSLEGKLLRTFEYTQKQALLVDPVTREGEAAIDRMRRKLSAGIHGDGVGVIGKIKSTSNVSTNTITLDDPNSLKNFEQDTTFQWEHTGAAGGTVSVEEGTIVSIGTEDTPTLTLASPWSTVFPGIQTGDFLYYTGTYNNDFVQGLGAYLPQYSAVTDSILTTAFLTCVRSVNPGWLAGRCMDGRGRSVYQRIKLAARRLVDAGGKPDTYVLSTRNFEKLEFEFDNKLQLQKFPAADIGKYKMGVTYQGVTVQGPRGPIKVLPSMWMPDNVERCGELDSIVIGSIGPLVHWDMSNGPKDLRTEDGTDNRELRAVGDPGFLVKKPGAWMRVQTA